MGRHKLVRSWQIDHATWQAWGWGFLLRPWMLTKLAGVAFLIGWHHFLVVERKKIASGRSVRTERFWREVNEIPFLAAIVIVLSVTTKWG